MISKMSSPRSPTKESTKTLLLPSPASSRRYVRLMLRPFRRRRMPTVRLGGRRGWRAGGRFIVRFLRRLRFKFLVTQYLKAMKRMKAYYSELLRDIVDGAATMEAVQARMLMETYFAVPIMPVSVAVGNHLR